MVRFSDAYVNEMKTVNASDNNVDGLLKSTYEKGGLDIKAFKGIWQIIEKEYTNIQSKIKKSKERFRDGFIEEVRKTRQALELLGIEIQKISNNDQMTENYEANMKGYLYNLVSSTNKIYRDNLEDMRILGYNETFFGKLRRYSKRFSKLFLTIGLATALHANTMESGLSNEQKQEKMKAVIEEYNKTHVNIPELGLIKIPDGYELYDIKDSTLVTNYTPTGKGLHAGKNKDGTKYEETGLTSTGHDALNDFSGAATADIPKGSIMYIDGVGWKIADDSGGALKVNAKKGITQIDVRTKNYKEAIQWGKQHKKAFIFVKRDTAKSDYEKVDEARHMFGKGMDTFFKKI
jgi:3D (Asp-Asp-Asp) domain-containing protein